MDYLNVATELMNNLSEKTLEPRPHYRILSSSPNDEEIDLKTWETSEKSEIGYIINDFNISNAEYVTFFSFYTYFEKNEFIKNDLQISLIKDTVFNIHVKSCFGEEIIFESNESFQYSGDLKIKLRLKSGIKYEVDLKITKSLKKLKNDQGESINKLFLKINNVTPQTTKNHLEVNNLLYYTIHERSNNKISSCHKEIKGYGLIPQIKSSDSMSVYDKISFLDYYIGEVFIHPMTSSKRSMSEFASELKEKGIILEKEVIDYIENEKFRLYLFQERSIKTVIEQYSGDRRPVILSARTAGGKTEAFILPVINEILKLKKVITSPSVKTLIFYPTKSLANDQLQRIIDIIYKINNVSRVKITLGAYHGDIEEKIDLNLTLPIKCPACKKDDARLIPLEDGNAKCTNSECRVIHDFIFLDRTKVVKELPDILISTPDAVNYFLINEPVKHTILGKPFNGTIVYKNEAKEDVNIIPGSSIKFILFDELHQFSSLFGGNISLFLKRLKNTINEYNKKYYNSSERIQVVAASATIKNPLGFTKDFFGENGVLVSTTEVDLDKSKEPKKKIIIFCCPKAYRMVDTTAYSIVRSMEYPDLKLLTFVNSLSTCGLVIQQVKARLSGEDKFKHLVDKCDGHNSQYSRQERADTEQKFDKNEIKALVATSTLELGVDFKKVDFLTLYGAPYSFNNYVQRIGRAGRNSDSIIMNVLSPINPIDLYYFRNCIDMIYNSSFYIEYPALPTDNEKLKEKHIIASFFDYCRTYNKDEETFFENLFANQLTTQNDLKNKLQTLWPSNDIDLVINELKEKIRMTTIKEKIEKIKITFKLFDLRKVEENVEIDFLTYSSANPRFLNTPTKRARKMVNLGIINNYDASTLRKIKRAK